MSPSEDAPPKLARAADQARETLARIARPVLWAARSAQGYRYGQRLAPGNGAVGSPVPAPGPGALEQYWDAHTEGPGIWKFRHYFEIYERHFSKFVGTDVHVAEIGIFSGGSLPMWRKYFGPQSHIYGIDIQEACRAYQGEGVSVFIGDQGDPAFWNDFRRQVRTLDIVIDDGGHQVDQQITTLEAVLPHLRPGGVYMCEDVGGIHNRFQAYVNGLSRNLAADFKASPFNQVVHSIHHYPFAVVIEKPVAPVERFVDERHGTRWEPFLGWEADSAPPPASI
jgi:23S rRNA U2552 (ribose-2'-O)-methylase RlmE/FtsJ